MQRDESSLIYAFNRFVSTFCVGSPQIIYWFTFTPLEQVCTFQILTKAFFFSPHSIYKSQCFGSDIN